MNFIVNYLRYTAFLLRDVAIQMFETLELPADFVIVGFHLL